MNEKTATSVFPFLRSCKEETDSPVKGELKGEIPKWLKGNLIRVGSGLLEIGPDKYNHLFDGLALMHKFSFENGAVTYQNKFLRSDTYRRNMEAKRILVSEFGTPGVPDPCKTIFQRFTSLFNTKEMTDNDLVNIILYADEAYACSETNCIWKINPETLESSEKVILSDFAPVNAVIAHAHEDVDGTVYNVGSSFGFNSQYRILKFPPKGKEIINTFKSASVLCSIPSCKKLTTSYHHSFGMTENYFIFVEQPLYMSMTEMARNHFLGGGSYADALHWDEKSPSRFHVVRRSDCKILDTVYVSKSFFVFHHINAYEESDHLIVDMCAYDSADIVNALYIKSIEDLFKNSKVSFEFEARAKRYVLPLISKDKIPEDNLNLVTLPNSSATALRKEDGSIFCTPEIITETDSWVAELPRINYEKYNGKKYKFFYAVASNKLSHGNQLIKVDVQNKKTLSWNESGVVPSEPVFISEPNSKGDEEDAGVLLASLLYTNDESKVSMLVLNAKTMKEIGRTTFYSKSSIPGDFHGTFITRH